MRCLYLAPSTLIATARIGAHHALPLPADPTRCLLVVEQWVSDEAQDAFEAYPNVVPLNPWNADKPAAPELISGFQGNKVASPNISDTQDSALWKIRALWPTARY